MAKPDEGLLAALSTCVVHARDLLESAKLVQASGRANIAYHLATLALEEMGRRELFSIHAAAATVGDVPPWQKKATQDHVKKLFWCFYKLGRIQDAVDQKQFFQTREAAADIHAIRMAGLYVEDTESGLSIPSLAISAKQSEALISLADAIVTHAESEKPRDEIPQDEIDLQIWFLNAFDNPELRKRIITSESLAKLKALDDVLEWTRQLKAEIEVADAKMKALAENELSRSAQSTGSGENDRWKIQLRIRTASNSIRSAPLKQWNENIRGIKLYQQQGARKKEELIVELLLGDNIPAAGIWPVGLSLSLRFIVAINMATSGFWWWPLAPNQQRFYEKIRDLEKDLEIQVEDASFKVFTQAPQLTDIHIQNLTLCLSALPGPTDQHRSPAYTYYLGGLTFISLNSIQWRCESQAFGNFLESFKLLMVEASFINDAESADVAIGRFLNDKYRDLDPPEHAAFLELIRVFERQDKRPIVKIGDVYLMKLLCETIFRVAIIPEVLRRKKAEFNSGPPDATKAHTERS